MRGVTKNNMCDWSEKTMSVSGEMQPSPVAEIARFPSLPHDIPLYEERMDFIQVNAFNHIYIYNYRSLNNFYEYH